MAQTTLRVPDELLERIEESTDPETSRSEWIREAIRRRLDEDEEVEERIERVEQSVGEIEERVDRIETVQRRPFYRRLF